VTDRRFCDDGRVAGLRERKKAKLRQSVQREAFRLFETQGYPATTVEQIAEAAEISTTTFYRYYSSKEDLVLSGSAEPVEDPAAVRADLAGSDDPAETLRVLARRAIQATAGERDEMLARYTLIFSVPELWAAFQHRQQLGRGVAATVLAEWMSASPDDFRVRLAVAGFAAGVTETLRYWTDRGGEPDLAALFDELIVRLAPLLRS